MGTQVPCSGPSPRGSPADGMWRRGRSRPPCLKNTTREIFNNYYISFLGPINFAYFDEVL